MRTRLHVDVIYAQSLLGLSLIFSSQLSDITVATGFSRQE